jgi:hypothetical protein
VTSFEQVSSPFDAIIITDLLNADETANSAIAALGADRVFVPQLLKTKIGYSRNVS